MADNPIVVFARRIKQKSDREVIEFVQRLQRLDSRSTADFRVAYERIMHDLIRRLGERGDA